VGYLIECITLKEKWPLCVCNLGTSFIGYDDWSGLPFYSLRSKLLDVLAFLDTITFIMHLDIMYI